MGAIIKHGECRRPRKYSRLYGIWIEMRRRCNSPYRKDFYLYGGRGIKVCDEWNKDFVSFKEWALSHGYKDNLTIERIDVNKGYTPCNCKWATINQQAHNKRTNRKYTLFGKTQTISEWAKEYNIGKTTLKARLDAGWNIEEAITSPSQYSTPTARGNHPITLNEETHTLTEWSKIVNIPSNTIAARIKRGWNIQEALHKKPTDKFYPKGRLLITK